MQGVHACILGIYIQPRQDTLSQPNSFSFYLMQPDISPNNMMESQSDFSSQETIIEPHVVIGRIQDWMRETTTSLTNLLQSIPPSDKTAVEKWLQEQKENGNTALVTLLQFILSAETEIGLNFHLEAQHPKQSNKQKSKAPKTQNSSGRKAVKAHLVTEEDKPLDKEALTEASRKMPEVQLVIKSPYIRSQDLETLAGSIRYPSRAPRFKNMFGVVQDTVDFTIKSDLRFNTHEEPFVFWCDIIYNPAENAAKNAAENGCYLLDRSGRGICATSSDELPTQQHMIANEMINPGAWRIWIKSDQTPSCFYPIFDILVRDKGFNISVEDRSVWGPNLFQPPPEDVQYNPMGCRITRTSISDLQNGETVRIKDLHDDKKTYKLQKTKHITDPLSQDKKRPYLFYCRHSKLPSIKLVAKVFRFQKDLTKSQMKQEMEFLKQIRHVRNLSTNMQILY